MAVYTWLQICIALLAQFSSSLRTAPATLTLRSSTSILIISFFISTEKQLRLTKSGKDEKPCSFYELLSASSWTWEYTLTDTTILRIPVASCAITLSDVIYSLLQRVYSLLCETDE